MTAIHGFLGLPSDWAQMRAMRSAAKPNWTADLIKLAEDDSSDCILPGLAQKLNRLTAKSNDPLQRNLVGYSMGGRIALHMLLEENSSWSSAVIVSASPGLDETSTSSHERLARLASDRAWAHRFRSEPWAQVCDAWNRQPVFEHDSQPPLRTESAFDREALAIALERGSVAVQADLRERLATLGIPILWIAGELDDKYRELAESCAALSSLFRCHIVPRAGHRVLFSHPADLSHLIESFIGSPYVQSDAQYHCQ